MDKKAFILASSPQSLANFRGQLILDLLEVGYEVHVCAPELSRTSDVIVWLKLHGVIFHDAPFNRAGLNPVRDLLALFKLSKSLKSIQPELFFAYTIKPVIWGTLAATWAKIPVRVALITGLGYAFTGEASGKRKLIQFIASKLYGAALQHTKLIFFQNKDDQQDFDKLGLLPNHVPVHIVNGSGINVDDFPYTPLPSQPTKFLLIARLLGDKGIREYVAAAKIIKSTNPETEFHLVGGLDSNPDALTENEVKGWVKEGIIHWHGQQTDVRSFIKNCHVYVLPSYREGTPRSVLEAMATGRGIITTDAPGCRETVISEKNGFLVPVRSVDALVNNMLKFIKDPELAVTMGKRSRDLAVEKYDVHKINRIMLRAMGVI